MVAVAYPCLFLLNLPLCVRVPATPNNAPHSAAFLEIILMRPKAAVTVITARGLIRDSEIF